MVYFFQCRPLLAASLVLLGLSGCASVAPEAYQRPALDLPTPPTRSPVPAPDRQWWLAFNDATLTALIEAALSRNFELAKASAHIAEAKAGLKSAESMSSPRLNAASKVGATQRQLTLGTTDINKVTRTATLGLEASWEVDLWGRIQHTQDATRARLAASEHTRNAVALSVSYAVTETYFQLLAYDHKLRVTQRVRQELEAITQLEYRRWKAEVGTELAYRQSMAELASTEARLPSLERAIFLTESALRLLAGYSPSRMSEGITRSDTLPTLPDTPKEFDSDLLLRRPDVSSAEQLLLASHTDVNVVRAERYPRMSLSLLTGLLASSSSLISGTPIYWDLGAGLAGPLYDAGLNESRVNAVQAQRERAQVQYRYAVATAFRETHDALASRESSDKQVTAYRSEVDMRSKALALTQKSYDAGRSSKFEVLIEKIKLLDSQLQVVDAVLFQYVARAQVYRALGGGF